MFADLRKRYKTIDEAEAGLGLSVESYIDSSPAQTSLQEDIDQALNLSPSLARKLTCLSLSQLIDLVIEFKFAVDRPKCGFSNSVVVASIQ